MRVRDRIRGVRGTRGRTLTLTAAAGLAAATLVAITPGAASADALPDNLKKFANCPVNDPDVTSCVFIDTKDTRIKMGKFDLHSPDPITLEFGMKFDWDTFETSVVAPTNGQNVMTASPIEVPGGILGIPGAGVGPLAAYATPELTALPKVSMVYLRNGLGSAFDLDLRAKISNPFTDALTILGTKCHVGSASDPIPLRLTTGTTNPPAPNTPISGQFNDATQVGQPLGGLKFPDILTVDNAFRAPGAHSCGLTGALNGVINLQGGLPSAAGKNAAEMTSDVYEVDANTLRDALAAPGNQISDAGFESSGMGPWACNEQCGVDQGQGNARTGANNGWVRNIFGWNDIHQTVPVLPNTDYTLTGWIRTSSNNNNGYFGVRKLDDTVISEKKYGKLTGYTQQTVQFNSGNNTQVRVFGGVWAVGDTWARFDDLSLTAS